MFIPFELAAAMIIGRRIAGSTGPVYGMKRI
jgi:hypothetical protein